MPIRIEISMVNNVTYTATLDGPEQAEAFITAIMDEKGTVTIRDNGNPKLVLVKSKVCGVRFL